MRRSNSTRRATKATTASLMVRLDSDSKTVLKQAADLRQISVSDYVRAVTVAQARREVRSAHSQIISLTPEEQEAFWRALQESRPLTKSQQGLGRIMRGEK